MNDKTQLNHNRRSYVLRLWRTDPSASFNWQASLEIPETGGRIGFASLEELFAYLMDDCESAGKARAAEDEG